MRTLLVGPATAMLTVSVAAAAPGAAKQRTLVTRGPVIALAADGDRAAFVVFSPCLYTDTCARLKVWEHNRRRLIQVTKLSHTSLLALAGTRVAWPLVGGTETVETTVVTATLARPKPAWVADQYSNRGADSGSFRPPAAWGRHAARLHRRAALRPRGGQHRSLSARWQAGRHHRRDRLAAGRSRRMPRH
jgi:hypothetical protein